MHMYPAVISRELANSQSRHNVLDYNVNHCTATAPAARSYLIYGGEGASKRLQWAAKVFIILHKAGKGQGKALSKVRKINPATKATLMID